MAERVKILAYMLISGLVSGLLFPLAVRWSWSGGFLSQLDPPLHDFAGSGVVHQLGGCAGIVGAIVIGSRDHRWDFDASADFKPHDVVSVLSGTLILWVGWYGARQPKGAEYGMCGVAA